MEHSGEQKRAAERKKKDTEFISVTETATAAAAAEDIEGRWASRREISGVRWPQPGRAF